MFLKEWIEIVIDQVLNVGGAALGATDASDDVEEEQEVIKNNSTITEEKSNSKINYDIKIESIKVDVEDESYDFLIKIVLAGDFGVGKTSFSKYVSAKSFQTNHRPTVGIDFVTCTLTLNTKERIRVQVWDTAGQEKFSALSSSFYRGADAVFIFADISTPKSFERVPKLLEDARKNSNSNMEAIFLSSKKDLRLPNSSLKGDGIMNEEEVKNTFNNCDNSIPVIETSAKTGENIEQALLTMIQRVYNKKKVAP
ncbi:hypothetical protein ABK040_011910 [Willaertia magna]